MTERRFEQDHVKRWWVFPYRITLNMSKIVQHIWEWIRFENTESSASVFDSNRPIRTTSDAQTWYSGKPCEPAKKSHINFCVFDSTWEAKVSQELDRSPHIEAWVKNDHLGFEIPYIFKGLVRKYIPDFIIRLKNGKHLILEVKGMKKQRDTTKWGFLDEWVNSINQHGGFGEWSWAVSRDPMDVGSIIRNYSSSADAA